MRMGMRPRFGALIAAMGLAFFATGCGSGGGGGGANPGLNQHIMKFYALHGQYASAHKGKPPANTAELRAWATKLSSQELSKLGIDNLEDALVSPRDKEEYQIAPPHKGRQMGPPAVVVYEKTGVDGNRMVAGGAGHAQEMNEETFNKLVPTK